MASKTLFLSSMALALPLLLILRLLLPGRVDLRCSPSSATESGQISRRVAVPLAGAEVERVGVSDEDLHWVRYQMKQAELGDPPKTAEEWSRMRKGINPRTREEQLYDLRRYHGISHYEDENHTRLPCPGELLVEQHHSNYGEPWAGGRDVFEFIATAFQLQRNHRVLEVGCGTLRVGIHFIRFLEEGHYHCIERDPLSLMAAFSYELPSQGLLHKRPVIVRTETMEIDLLGPATYDVVYASAAFLHMPGELVWIGLQRLSPKLSSGGRVFVSHNIKFCSRLGNDECNRKLAAVKLKYLGQKTHDSLLFNHFEIWHEFEKL